MYSWESKLAIPDGHIAPYQKGNNVRFFKLVAEPIAHPILSDVSINALGYNGGTPGPLIIVRQGEWLMIELENRLDEKTSLHVHGLVKPDTQGGIFHIQPTPAIEPGKSHTYQFRVLESGTFLYHSSDPSQTSMGLTGPLIVLPHDHSINPAKIPDRDYTLFIQQWEIENLKLGIVEPGIYDIAKFDRNPNFFTLNGKAFPDTSPLYTRLGEKVRIRFINKSSTSHSMHVHGHNFSVVEVDGFSRNIKDDTISIASSQRWDIEFRANNPGRFPINGTKVFHQSNNGVSPGGMTTRLIYK